MITQAFAGQYAIGTANHTGQPQTVFQDGFDSWGYCAAHKVPSSGVRPIASWLPSYYFLPRAYPVQSH